jgi:phenylalanyl-tRNA synthetase beta chain
MKFTLSWLKDHLETDATLDQILDGLIGVGLEVEDVADKTKLLAPFAVAYVVEARKHPNADKLRVCDVETAGGMLKVVCGAPNARTGMKAIIALPGSVIPVTGAVLEQGVIRGEPSQGMLCSERELLISEEHDGIIEVASDLPVGTPAAVALGLDDPMIYVKVTPNRPDALGVRGIARDLAAKGLGKLKPLQAEPVKTSFKSPIGVELRFADANKPCPLFVGRLIRGVKNGPSPEWLRRRLTAIGLRPISALVDITNYMTFTHARPLHVFDAAHVKGNIHARFAKDGEEITALDGKTYQLDASMTVIADDNGAEAIAGIMGGMASGCSQTTTDVFLEAAFFDPIRTATTGRRLAINSDARYRFERGIDPAFTQTGAEIATRMILDLCGGEASELIIAGEVPQTTRSFTLRKSRVASLGGLDIAPARQKSILEALGFNVTETADAFTAAVPSWRPDVHGEADLVEEICRIAGLENVPPVALPRVHEIARPVLNTLQKRMLAARRELAARGLNEAVTWSFLPHAAAKLFGGGQPELQLANPISSELTDMRPSLLPNLLAAAARNMARGFQDLSLFELGQAYAGDKPEDETLRAAGIRRGTTAARDWTKSARGVDVYDVKADALAALEAAGAPIANLQVVAEAPAWFHPGRSGTLQLGPKNKLAVFGEIHPKVLKALDVKGPVMAFELVLNTIPEPKSKSAARPALEALDLLPVTRDFAFVVDQAVEADKLIKAARSADKQLISDVGVFDVFAGGALAAEGRKSLAIEVTLQPRGKTLTDEEIDAVSAKIVQAVNKATGGTLRA